MIKITIANIIFYFAKNIHMNFMLLFIFTAVLISIHMKKYKVKEILCHMASEPKMMNFILLCYSTQPARCYLSQNRCK